MSGSVSDGETGDVVTVRGQVVEEVCRNSDGEGETGLVEGRGVTVKRGWRSRFGMR